MPQPLERVAAIPFGWRRGAAGEFELGGSSVGTPSPFRGSSFGFLGAARDFEELQFGSNTGCQFFENFCSARTMSARDLWLLNGNHAGVGKRAARRVGCCVGRRELGSVH